MRVVVLGPYPPSGDPSADLVLAAVKRLRAEGATVSVVSREPSAAPDHGDPDTWAGGIRIGRVLRGADRVLWFVAAERDARASRVSTRALAGVPVVEVVRIAPWVPAGETLVDRGRRAVAGAPTLVRTVARRVRRPAAGPGAPATRGRP